MRWGADGDTSNVLFHHNRDADVRCRVMSKRATSIGTCNMCVSVCLTGYTGCDMSEIPDAEKRRRGPKATCARSYERPQAAPTEPYFTVYLVCWSVRGVCGRPSPRASPTPLWALVSPLPRRRGLGLSYGGFILNDASEGAPAPAAGIADKLRRASSELE